MEEWKHNDEELANSAQLAGSSAGCLSAGWDLEAWNEYKPKDAPKQFLPPREWQTTPKRGHLAQMVNEATVEGLAHDDFEMVFFYSSSFGRTIDPSRPSLRRGRKNLNKQLK